MQQVQGKRGAISAKGKPMLVTWKAGVSLALCLIMAILSLNKGKDPSPFVAAMFVILAFMGEK